MMSPPPEGWYPDPDGVHQFRFHDGRDWTAHVANDGVMTQAPRSAVRPGGTEVPLSAAGQSAGTGTDWNVHLAQEYGRACIAVLDAAEAALMVANQASGAWQMTQRRPQHEISIRNFTNFAQRKEAEFAPLYQVFQRAVATAREAGNKLSAQFAEPSDAETCLLVTMGDAYSQIGAAIEYLRANFPPDARGFLDTVRQVNQAIQATPGFGMPGFAGNVYSGRDASGTSRL
jgi:hypothetical protein